MSCPLHPGCHCDPAQACPLAHGARAHRRAAMPADPEPVQPAPAEASTSIGALQGDDDDDFAIGMRFHRRARRWMGVAIGVTVCAVLLSLAACGGGDDDECEQRRQPAPPDCQANPEACR